MSEEIVLSRSGNSYAGHFKYCDASIHASLEKNEMIEKLMTILIAEMPWYEYKLQFKIEDGKFINELNITQNGPARENDTRDKSGDEAKESPYRRDCGYAI